MDQPDIREECRTVLVIENDPGVNLLIRKALEREGLRTDFAVNGRDGLALMKNCTSPLVLLDYLLPDMNGKDVMIAANLDQCGVEFVIMTGHGDERIAVELMKLGARDYVVKNEDFISSLPRIVSRILQQVNTERELARAERVLRDSAREWQTTFDAISDPVWIVDRDRTILQCNEGMCAVLEKSREHILGRKCHELLHGTNRPLSDNGCGARGVAGKPAPFTLRLGRRHLEAEVYPVRDEHGEITKFVHTAVDRTERISAQERMSCVNRELVRVNKDLASREKQLREAVSMLREKEDLLRENEERFRALFEYAPDAYYLNDSRGRIIEGNRAAEELTGYRRDEFVGKNMLNLLSPDQLPRAAALLKDNLADRPTGPDEFVLTCKDGRRVHVEVRTHPLTMKGEMTVLGIARDITARKRAEEDKAKLEERLRQSQKLEAIGQLAGGISHDFNNILGGIAGHAELLKMHLENDVKLHGYAERILNSSLKAANLTRQLLTFARKTRTEKSPLDVHACIKQAIAMLSHTIDKRITIRESLTAGDAVITGDAVQIENALLNLAINARDAMPKGGEIFFETGTVELDKESFPEMDPRDAGTRCVAVTVRDTGTGMDEEVMKHLFEPFFTTKKVGKGTGLGLPSVYGAIKQHGGYITVNTIPGKGTEFRIFLPLAETAGEPAESASTIPRKGSGRLLVVDDEESIRSYLFEMLGHLGYSVVCCADGEEAVEYFSKHHRSIDAVILDLMMPRMGGLDCFRRLKETDPAVRVVVLSGYGDQAEREQIMTEGAVVLIEKPVRADDLSRVIDETVNAGKQK